MRDVISLDTMVVATSEEVSADVGGETVILHLRKGVYYGLDAVGTRIWNLIHEPRSAREVRDILLEEYDVEPDECAHHLVLLLQHLLAADLIRVEDAPTTPISRSLPERQAASA